MQKLKFIIFVLLTTIVMKYLIRAVKYFFYITILISIILGILVLLKFVSSDVNVMFKNGWNSIWQILLMFACVAAFYPRFGFTKRLVPVLGDLSDLKGTVLATMRDRGYLLENDSAEVMTFRSKSTFNRISRMLEDRITIEKGLGGFYVEGPTKDVTRIVYGLEYNFRNPDSPTE